MESGSHLMEQLLLGPVSRLKNIVRFSNSHKHQTESVAEHSYSTALYALVLGEELRRGGLEIDVELAVKRALLHDVEESHSGDFIRTFKHSDPALVAAIEKASRNFAEKIFRGLSPKGWLPLFQLWENAKDKSLEGQLVEFADFLSVVSYILREGRMGNRALVREHAESLGDYANRFNHGRYDFLRPQVKVAQRMLFDAILGKECI